MREISGRSADERDDVMVLLDEDAEDYEEDWRWTSPLGYDVDGYDRSGVVDGSGHVHSDIEMEMGLGW